MIPEALYTSMIISLSIGFFATSIVYAHFIEDRARYYVPGFVLLSIFATFLIELPRVSFDPLQIFTIPIGSAIAFGIFFYAIHFYIKAKAP